jgi:hypothetical protein
MEEQNIYQQLRSLDQRITKLKSWLKLASVGWLLTVSAFIISATSTPGRLHSLDADTVKLRKLVILDEENKERIVIAAPIPDPMVNGK